MDRKKKVFYQLPQPPKIMKKNIVMSKKKNLENNNNHNYSIFQNNFNDHLKT